MKNSFTISQLTLEEILTYLKNSGQVEGVLAMGSTAKPTMKPYSDYDLAIILADDAPDLYTASIWINQQLGDLYFFSHEKVTSLLDHSSVDNNNLDHLLIWAQTGTILYDPKKYYARLREIPRSEHLIKDPTQTIHEVWFGVNFNYAHNKRYFNSGDDLYLMALELRLLYCSLDLLMANLTLQGIRWQGEKAAIKYFEKNDPTFLALFLKTIRQSHLKDKFADYSAMVEHVLSEIGGVWSDDECSVLMNNNEPIGSGVDWLNEILTGD